WKAADRASRLGNLLGSLPPQFYCTILRFDWFAHAEAFLSKMDRAAAGDDHWPDSLRFRGAEPRAVRVLVWLKIWADARHVGCRSGGQETARRACLGKRS